MNTHPLWTSTKHALIRAGLDPWLRPVVDTLRGRHRDADDLATRQIIASLPRDAVCVDVGCHKGLYLDPMRRRAARGRFFAFEPIPYLCDLLRAKYRNDRRVAVFNAALSDSVGTADLFINNDDMGLSGLSRRNGRKGIDQNRMRKTSVAVSTLDILLRGELIDFMKIDVEGAEYAVLMGARDVLARSRPLVLFEFGLGGAEYFGVDADRMYSFFEDRGYAVYTVTDYAAGGAAFERNAFRACFASNSAYNFVAVSRR